MTDTVEQQAPVQGGAKDLGQSPFLWDVDRADRKIWRLILTIIVGGIVSAVAAMVVFAIGGLALLLPRVESPDPAAFQAAMQGLMENPTVGFLALAIAANVIAFGGFAFIAALFRRKPFKSYVTAAARFRWRLLLAGAALFVVIVGPLLALSAWMDPELPAWPLLSFSETLPGQIGSAAVLVLVLLAGAAVEEILFRGWLLKQVAAFTRNTWLLLLLNGVLFSAIHFPQDQDWNAVVPRAVMGAGFVYMVLRTGGIELATGVHAANNILIMLFIQNIQLQPDKAAEFDAMGLVGSLAIVLGYVAITEIVMRWKALSAWTNARIEPQGVV